MTSKLKDLEGNSSNTTPFQEKFNNILNDNDAYQYIQPCFETIINMNSPIAKFWLSYMEMVEILLLHYHSMRTQNWKEYLTSLQMMLPWMSTYDSVHYCKYLSLYWSTMNNLDQEKLSYMNADLFAASVSGQSFSALPHNQWTEMTMNKGSKMKGGWIGITQIKEALHTNTKVVKINVKVKESVKVIADISKDRYKHIECSPSRMKKDEEALQGAMKALQEWNSNPWDPDITALRSLESGQLASKQLEKDFSTAKELGEQQISQFFQERVLSDEKKIYDRIALNKRKKIFQATERNYCRQTT